MHRRLPRRRHCSNHAATLLSFRLAMAVPLQACNTDASSPVGVTTRRHGTSIWQHMRVHHEARAGLGGILGPLGGLSCVQNADPKHVCMYVFMYVCVCVCVNDCVAVSTRVLAPPAIGTDGTLKGTCWWKPWSQPSCATLRAISPIGRGRATKPATVAAATQLPATAVLATSDHEETRYQSQAARRSTRQRHHIS